jgi:hypothetical protein
MVALHVAIPIHMGARNECCGILLGREKDSNSSNVVSPSFGGAYKTMISIISGCMYSRLVHIFEDICNLYIGMYVYM